MAAEYGPEQRRPGMPAIEEPLPDTDFEPQSPLSTPRLYVVSSEQDTAPQPADDSGAEPAPATPKPRKGLLGRLPKQVSGRLGWGVGDQAVSSLSNFAVTLYLARSLGAAEFGAFSLAYVTYSFALNASRGLATDPLVVRFSGVDRSAWRQAVAKSSGTAAVVGLVTGAAVLIAAMILHGTARSAFLALGLTLPVLLLQDSWRYAFFALGRGSGAFLNDSVWALALVPALLFLHHYGHAGVFWFVLAWGAAAAVAAAVGPLQTKIVPRLTGARAWVFQQRDLGPRYMAENTSNSGAGQLRTYALGLIAGLAAVGYVQAASTLMGPFLVMFMGLSLVTVPEAARLLRRSPRHLRLFCILVGAGLAITGFAWGGFLLVALPRGLGHLALGHIWVKAYPLVWPLTLSVVGACLQAGATTGLRALGLSRRSLRAMLTASGVYLVLGLAGAALDGARGTVWGAAAATWIGAVLWWWQLRAGLHESELVPDGAGLGSRRAPARHRAAVRPARGRGEAAGPGESAGEILR